MLRAWMVSIAILLSFGLLWAGAIAADFWRAFANGLLWFSPIPAGFVMARFAPSRKIINGLLLAIPAAVMFATANYLDELFGNRGSFPGIEGAITVFVLTLPTSLGFCGLAALLGKFLTKQNLS